MATKKVASTSKESKTANTKNTSKKPAVVEETKTTTTRQVKKTNTATTSKDTKQFKKFDDDTTKTSTATRQMRKVDVEEDLIPEVVEEPKKKKEVVELAPIDVGEKFETDVNTGLTAEEVEARVVRGYVNKSHTGSTKTIKQIIFSNTVTFFNILMLSIAIVLIIFKDYRNLFFLLTVTANTVIGIVQEIRAKNTIDKLSLLSSPTATVLRDKKQEDIAVADIVIDDILVFAPGKQICSDCIVKKGKVEVNESLLTGESDAIVKKEGDTLLSGSFIVSGNCKAKVMKIGKDNYIETLSAQAKKYSKPKSHLLKSLNIIIRIASIVVIPIGVLAFINNYYNFVCPVGVNCTSHYKLTAAFSKTAGSVVGMIPAGLFLTTSIALAVGVINLAKHKTLVQELYCIEMLARVNVLCLDKTGTITDGSMKVKKELLIDKKFGLANARSTIAAINQILDENNLTAQALKDFYGTSTKHDKVASTLAFSSARKYSSVTFEKQGTFFLGAPEFVLKNKYNLVSAEVEEAAQQGFRVLLLAHKSNNSEEIKPISLVIIEDTLRDDAIETIARFKKNGVAIKVISGDNPLTVSKVAARVGVENADQYISLDGLTDEEVKEAALKYTVLGRVNPAQKQLIVKTLKEHGSTVAMTGDGVNDILALKEADCSIAMASGAEATRNVSQLVLLDSNFSSLPKVVGEGRRVVNNVEKVATLFLTKTLFSLILTMICLIIRKEYPFSPQNLYMIEWFVIGVPSVILAIEPNNSIIKGKFLINVFKNALPGALAVVTSSVLLYAFAGRLNLDPDQVTTILTLSATITCLMVLGRVCKPFNWIRATLFFSMAFLIALTYSILGTRFFEFSKLATDQVILLLLMVETSYILLKIYVEVYQKIKNAIFNYLVHINKVVDDEDFYY